MNRFPCFIAALLLLVAPVSWARKPAPAAEVPPIYNVVDLVEQACDGPAKIRWNVHPQRAQIQRSGLLPLGDLGYGVNFAKIADFRDWTAAIRLHDRSRQTDDSYVLFTKTGYGPFDAAYVITRLPQKIPNAQHALQVIMQMQQGNAGSGKASFIQAETPFGQGMEMIVGGRLGSTCFPTSRFQYADSPQASSIGISRFSVRGRDLIEYALVLPWPEGMSQTDAVRLAQSRMSVFQRGLEAVAH